MEVAYVCFSENIKIGNLQQLSQSFVETIARCFIKMCRFENLHKMIISFKIEFNEKSGHYGTWGINAAG